MTAKGFVKQYKSGFKTKVKLPDQSIEMKWFKSAEEALKKTEQPLWRYFGGIVIRWEPKVVKCGGVRK